MNIVLNDDGNNDEIPPHHRRSTRILCLCRGFQTNNRFRQNHLGNHACHEFNDDYDDYDNHANGDNDDLDNHDGDNLSISWFSNKQSFLSEPSRQSCLS